MPTPKPHRLFPLLARLTGGLALLAPLPFLSAQVTPEVEEEDIINLSPFVVQTDQDTGYRVENTLAGNRLNSRLQDVGAAISVFNEDLLDDLGATRMKDIILYSSNSVPDYGDAAPNYNGNPMIGNEEWLVRIRGLSATYMRNYWKWETSSDFFNVSRIDQSRGPNAILFGFGAAGGVVNTTTKQASLAPMRTDVDIVFGSWDRYRAALDWNQVIVDDTFAVRLNAMAENRATWRQHEFQDSRRLHLASTWKPTKSSMLRGEFETGQVDDNVARTWLAIDQAWQWRLDGRPTYDGPQWNWPVSANITQAWSPRVVYVANNGSVMDWQNQPFTYLANASWPHLEITPENLALIPRNSNLAGPGAVRDIDYKTYSVVYENWVSEAFSFELAYNHQRNDFLGYDGSAGAMSRYGYLGDSSSVWGDAANWLPPEGNWAANPYAGQLYVENNWTRRTNWVESDNFRGTASYEFDLGAFGRHNLAGMFQRTLRDSYGREESEVWTGAAFGEAWDRSREFAEFDSNRVFRRYYFENGDASAIHVPSWETPLTYQHWSGTYQSGWVPNQEINDVDLTQDTFLLAGQSYFLDDRLVMTLGFRRDKVDETKLGAIRDANGAWATDVPSAIQRDLTADTMSLGAVYHLTRNVSLAANTSNARNLPNVNQRIIGLDFAPMPKGVGMDVGLRFNLLGGKLYAAANYYTTDYENTAEWGDIGTNIRDRNNTFLRSFADAGLITPAERDARLLVANSYLEDRRSDGWELELIANPLPNWKVTANFTITNVEKTNIMTEVQAWAEEATAYWLSVAGPTYNFGGGDWDTLSNQIGWMQDGIYREVAFDGRQARGEREFGSSLYTNYSFTDGPLRGFSIGGGVRYRSPNGITYTYDSISVVDGRPTMVNGQLIEGHSLVLADMSLGYAFERQVGSRPIKVSFQLNVSNIFDTDRDQIYDVAWWDATRAARLGLEEPRGLHLTTTISF